MYNGKERNGFQNSWTNGFSYVCYIIATTLIHNITYIKVSYRRYSELLIIHVLNKRHAATSMINCFLNCFAMSMNSVPT